MATLHIKDSVTGRTWRVWPEPEDIPPGCICENGNFLFLLSECPEADGADLLVDDQPLEALRTKSPGVACWRWSPGFYAGTAEIEIRIPGTPRCLFEVVTDPDVRKLTRSDFDTMVREILDDTLALFTLSGFRKGVSRGTGGARPAIARIEFLRSRVAQLEAVLARIARRPRFCLSAADTAVPYHRAIRATGPEILASFRSSRILREESSVSALPAVLGGFLPSQIRLRQRQDSLDLPEHRQMRACLQSWAAWVAAAAELLDRDAARGDAEAVTSLSAWACRCRRISRQLGVMANAPPLHEAGPALPRLAMSALFRNDPNYRQFFRIYQDMNLGIANFFGEFLNMPLARTFDLYELWCFLRLVRAATEEFGSDSLKTGELFVAEGNGGITLASGAVTVALGSKWKLCFQKQYREYWVESSGQGSFSRMMTPDIVLAAEAPSESKALKIIVLDAKYRIEGALNPALNSIHTYRDALVREVSTGQVEGIVAAAYLLAPHVPGLLPTYRETALPARLFHPDFRRTFSFGAVTLRPGCPMSEVRAALRAIIAHTCS